jgi:hypothetical protein
MQDFSENKHIVPLQFAANAFVTTQFLSHIYCGPGVNSSQGVRAYLLLYPFHFWPPVYTTVGVMGFQEASVVELHVSQT